MGMQNKHLVFHSGFQFAQPAAEGFFILRQDHQLVILCQQA